MAHFAQLDDSNTVLQVIVLNNATVGEPELAYPQTEPVGQMFIAQTLGFGWNWKQCSYNGTFRKQYAGIGYTYDEQLDAFIPPQPYPSWVLNETTCLWEAPVPYPNDGVLYVWNEATISWQPEPEQE